MSKKLLKSNFDLMKSLSNLLTQTKYANITVTKICNVAGYNRATFYQHYYTKDDLLAELIDTKIKDMFKVLHNTSKVIVNQNSRKLIVYELFFNLLNHVQKNYGFFKAIFEDKQITGFRTKLFSHYTEYLRKTLSNPIHNPNQDRSIDDFYYIYASASSMGLITFWINQGLKQPIDYVIKQFLSIATERPNDLILGNIPFKVYKTNQKKELDPRIIRTRNALSNSLIELMKNYNYSKIKVNDIVEHAQYNRSTFYSHFENKDDLFFRTVDDFIEGLIHALRSTNNYQSTNEDSASSPLNRLFTYVYTNSKILEVVSGKNIVPGFYNKIYNGLLEIFKDELKDHFEYDIDIYSNYIASTILGVISFWISEDLKYSPRYISKLFHECLDNPPKYKEDSNTVKVSTT